MIEYTIETMLVLLILAVLFIMIRIALVPFLAWRQQIKYARMVEADRYATHRAMLRQSGNTLKPELTHSIHETKWFRKKTDAQEIAELFADSDCSYYY